MKAALRVLLITPLTLGVRCLFGARSYSRDIVHMRRGHHKTLTANTRGGLAPPSVVRGAAIVALFPNDENVPFTVNLMKGFAAAGFFVLGVSTKPLVGVARAELMANSHHILERENIGYDFGSFQTGLRWLKQQTFYDSLEAVAMANDSLFYPAAIAQTIADLLGKGGEWLGLFENFHIHRHVQSFFQIFRGNLLRSHAFDKFWTNYRAFSSRVYAINRGEVGLSRALINAGFTPTIAYASKTIQTETLKSLSDQAKAKDVLERLKTITIRMKKIFNEKNDFSDISALTFAVGRLAETTNPTHSVALLCNYLFTAPLKCDLCSRGLATIDEMMRLALGFSADEKRSMKRVLDIKGGPVPRVSWKGLKQRAGIV